MEKTRQNFGPHHNGTEENVTADSLTAVLRCGRVLQKKNPFVTRIRLLIGSKPVTGKLL